VPVGHGDRGGGLKRVRQDISQEVPSELRQDVDLLRTVLGQVLLESGGPELVRDVDALRQGTIALRAEPTEARRRTVIDLVASFDLDRAEAVARAFTVYFQLLNLAEQRHRVRTLRSRGRKAEPLPESLEAAVAQIRATEGEEVLRAGLERLEVIPVVTAHPTEARRRSVIDGLQRIAEILDAGGEHSPTRVEEAHLHRRMFEEVTNLWRTGQVRTQRPDPLDEVRSTIAVFDTTLFRLVPLIYRDLDLAISPRDAGLQAPRCRAFLRWGSWVGGDRDGNPRVTAEVTRAAVTIQADHILRGLGRVIRRIARSLTATSPVTPASDELLASLDADARRFPDAAVSLRHRVPDQPHRIKLELAADRLDATRAILATTEASPIADTIAYPDVGSFLEDLRLVQASLVRAGAARLAYGELQHLVWQAETFGFHLVSLEVRQHSSVHDRAMRELAPEVAGDPVALDRLAAEGWPPEMSSADGSGRSAETVEVLETFRAVASVQARFGQQACHRYVVSFTRSPADVITVHALARLAVPSRALMLDVTPLFESEADLSAGPNVLEELFELPGMSAWLESRDQRLEVMLGYSDSAKDMGFLAANVALYRAQTGLARWAERRGIALTVFHGRGGAAGRGGGPANHAIRGQAAGSVGGRFKVTEQGEVILARYGDVEIARRNLEQVANAVLVASTPGHQAALETLQQRHEPMLERMADAAKVAYRSLVESEGFVEFFTRATPIGEIERLPLGSRPARRIQSRDLTSLRAIPWVFAWTQSRINLPGWYGLGTGLAAVTEGPGGVERLRAMYAEWPFFRSLLESAELSLVKADMDVAQLYMGLADRPDLAQAIRDEYARTVEHVLEVAGHATLLQDRALLARAVALRNPYVDALSFIQVRFLQELRNAPSGAAEVPAASQLVLTTVNGIAAGLQDTG
jgi:phosphoenolpyruvate carboxylase